MPSTDRDMPDAEVSEAFERRYAGIEAELPPTPTFHPGRRPSSSPARFALIAGFVMIVAVLAAPMLGLLPTARNPSPTDAPNANSTLRPDADFPSEVDGMPVVSVARAVDLLEAGRLDGRAVAVAGYYAAAYPRCPPTFRYVGPLERFCEFVAFADTPDGARICTSSGSGTSCHQPTGTFLSPFFMPESAGDPSQLMAYRSDVPWAMVVIGHAGDPRQWHCTAETQDACANAFVVDRVAWMGGVHVALVAPQPADQQTGGVVGRTMGIDRVIAASGLGEGVVTAAAFRSRDLAVIDPRITFVGENVQWLVRQVGAGSGSSTDETRPELVWLVDDATGRVAGPWPMVDPGYVPARIWQQATVHGYECCGGDVFAASRFDAGGGPVHEGRIPGSAMGDQGFTVFGGGYGSTPVVLPAGTYELTVWLGPLMDPGVVPDRSCSMSIQFDSNQSYAYDADFPPDGRCTIKKAPVPSGSDQP